MTKTPVWLSAEEALTRVDSGMSVLFPHLSAEPLVLTRALWSRAETLERLTVCSGMLLSGYGFLSSPAAPKVTFKTWFLPGTLLRKTTGDVKAEYLPMTWAQTARYLDETPFDVGLIQVSPADTDGYYSVGLNSTVVQSILRRAKLVIAQVNPKVPRTRGPSRIDPSQIDILVEAEEPLAEFPNRPGDAIDETIGRQIAGLIPDGAAVSFGVGGIPLAAAEALIARGARGLRPFNTLTDPVMKLIEAGCAADGLPKAHAGDIFGSQALYDWVHENDAVAMTEALQTHTVESFVGRSPVASVNSGLEIDLYGQVNAETIGGRQSGAMGGLVDFAISGQLADSTFILGLRSRTNKGKARIVRRLDGDIVSVSRTFVETVVTEHGVASLRNKTVRERARAIAAIAHPDDRAALLAEAETLA
ncbi:acetyl-CoA hydrolase/transferase family protein [Poseidonocella sp. HB161398]|uniref:acetyl-CoA hydrolase/transferase family protein n=1 Tax=Poseidonocella sp. HB161398 TaxID=2320855 RepID=UPI001107F24B|nr:acetyl-CoA hydrolase/transferase C-terminal domain-containing protein [Poseidonocella sp. HB161398]